MTPRVPSDRAGCSESLLSKIENGKAYSSLPMLQRPMQCLGMSMGGTFEDRARPNLVIDGRPHRSSEGDAFASRSDQAHSYPNVGDKRGSVFRVDTPPMA